MRTFQGEADTVGQTEGPQTLDLRELREGLAQDSLAEAHAQALQRMKGRQIAHTCTNGPSRFNVHCEQLLCTACEQQHQQYSSAGNLCAPLSVILSHMSRLRCSKLVTKLKQARLSSVTQGHSRMLNKRRHPSLPSVKPLQMSAHIRFCHPATARALDTSSEIESHRLECQHCRTTLAAGSDPSATLSKHGLLPVLRPHHHPPQAGRLD